MSLISHSSIYRNVFIAQPHVNNAANTLIKIDQNLTIKFGVYHYVVALDKRTKANLFKLHKMLYGIYTVK